MFDGNCRKLPRKLSGVLRQKRAPRYPVLIIHVVADLIHVSPERREWLLAGFRYKAPGFSSHDKARYFSANWIGRRLRGQFCPPDQEISTRRDAARFGITLDVTRSQAWVLRCTVCQEHGIALRSVID